MFLDKIKTALLVMVGVGVVAAGTGHYVTTPAANAQTGTAAAQAKPKDKAVTDKPPAPKAAAPANAAALKAQEDMLAAAMARLQATEAQVRQLQDKLQDLQIALSQARSDYEATRTALALEKLNLADRVAKGEEAKKAPSTPPPLPPLPGQDVPKASSVADKALNLPAVASTDLVQLATSYLDAVRDFETAKLQVRRIESLTQARAVSVEELEIGKINFRAAERKMNLLRAIVESSLRGAEAELQYARRMHEKGFMSAGGAAAAQTKVEVLNLILGSSK